MTLSSRDRRALAWLAVSAIISLAFYFWPQSTPTVVAPSGDPVKTAELRLTRLRETAATAPEKEAILKKVRSELTQRERGVLKADTAPQAQAQLMQILRRLASAEKIDIRSTELGPVRAFGEDYGEVNVSVSLDCKVEQLINLLAALPVQNELVANSDLRIVSANAKDKSVGVRLTVLGVVPKRLVPQKPKGAV